MKKPSSRIREDIARLQDQLRQAETREAERIGRIALKAGLGEVLIDEPVLQAAFEGLAKQFRGRKEGSNGKGKGQTGFTASGDTAPDASGEAQGRKEEA